MDTRRDSTFLLFTWSVLFVFLPLQIPIFEWKNTIILPIWNGILQLFFSREILIFSDSEGFLFIITLLLIFSVVLFGITRFILKENTNILQNYLRPFLVGCVFIIFAKYGLDKIMLLQFPPVEPNLLLTQLGDLDKDILFWTSMGTSRLYNLTTGSIEIIGSLFLLFHRTRRLGLMLLLLSILYIVLLNFSFNIGVKMFALILGGTLITLNWNTLKFIFTYFLGFGEEKDQPRKKRVYLPILKVVFAASLLLFFYEQNQENKIENELMGAYKNCCGEELAFVYVNQQDYWIEENKKGERLSFKILQQSEKVMQVEDENGERTEFHFHDQDGNFTYEKEGRKSNFTKLDLSQAPLIQDKFQLIIQ